MNDTERWVLLVDEVSKAARNWTASPDTMVRVYECAAVLDNILKPHLNRLLQVKKAKILGKAIDDLKAIGAHREADLIQWNQTGRNAGAICMVCANFVGQDAALDHRCWKELLDADGT